MTHVRFRGTQGRRTEKSERGAIINAGRVKLRALEAIATFHVDGRTLNYKHEAVASSATVNPLTAGVIYDVTSDLGPGRKMNAKLGLFAYLILTTVLMLWNYVQHVLKSPDAMSTTDLLTNLKSTFLSVSRRQQLSSYEWDPLGRPNGLTFSVNKINWKEN